MQKMKIGLVQMGLKTSTDLEPAAIRDTMNEAHLPLIKQAAEQAQAIADQNQAERPSNRLVDILV